MPANDSLLTRPGRRIGALLLMTAIAISVGGCTSAASPSSAASPGLPGSGVSAPTIGAPVSGTGFPAVAPGLPGVMASGGNTGVGSASSAIAYPYPIYGGSPGIAPDHSILVTGTGQAALSVDGSNRAAAEHKALVAAVADAKSRADAVAAAAGVSIQSVLSVSVSVGQGWIGPIGIEAPSGPALPQNGGAPAPVMAPTMPQLEVTITIAYTIN